MADTDTPLTGLPNQRQELFCRYYVRRPVGAEAARAAGYEPGNSRVQAYRLLDRPEIQARIAALRAEIAEHHCRDANTLLAKLETVYAHGIEHHQFHAAARALSLQARMLGTLGEAPSLPADAPRGANAGPAEAPSAAPPPLAMLRNG